MSTSLFGPADALSSSPRPVPFSPAEINLSVHIPTTEGLTRQSPDEVLSSYEEMLTGPNTDSRSNGFLFNPNDSVVLTRTSRDQNHANHATPSLDGSIPVDYDDDSRSDNGQSLGIANQIRSPDPSLNYPTSFETSHASVHGSDDASHDSRTPETRWDLRRSHARAVPINFGCTWIDHDDSGDYDPNKPTSTCRPAILRRKRSYGEGNHVREDGTDDGSKRKKLTSWLSARQNGVELPVILKLNSSKGKALLANFTDNWPKEPWNFLCENGLNDSLSPYSPYSLRNRIGDSDLGNRWSRPLELDDYTVAEDEDSLDLTGHPIARGCQACRLIGQRCPLLELGSTYPCDLCVEDDCECELIVPPKRKQTCQHCKTRRKSCSYEEEAGDHSQACDQCRDLGFHCVAGPAFDPLRTRIGDDGTPARIPMPRKRTRTTQERKQRPARERGGRYLRCAACEDASKRCSLRRDALSFPCQWCADTGQKCSLERSAPVIGGETAETSLGVATPDITQDDPRLIALRMHASSIKATLLAPTPAPSFSSQETTQAPQQLLRIRGGITKNITTKLSHPIKFNCSLPTKLKPCNWCADPAFGLTGFGITPAATVKVIEPPSSKYCFEIAGGHTSSGSLPCRMCVDCTLPRILICACAAHHLRQIPPPPSTTPTTTAPRTDPRDFDWHASFSRLERSSHDAAERRAQQGRWCALCPQLALFECDTVPDGVEGEDAVLPTVGCGLRLCEACAVVCVELCGNDLQATVLNVGDFDEAWPLGLRADYEVYAQDGYLMRQVLGE